MKKSVLTIVVLATLIFTLGGCGGGMPSDIDKDTYNLGKDALTVLEEYRDDKMSDTEATDRLKVLQEKVEKVKPKEEYDQKNFDVQIAISTAQTQIMLGESVIDQIQDLKVALGMEEE